MPAIEAGTHAKEACSIRSEEEAGMDDAAVLAKEMRSIVFRAAAPRPGDKIKTQMNRAHSALQSAIPSIRLPFWRVRAAWKLEAGCWSGRAMLDLQKRDAVRQRREEAARAQAEQLGELFADIADHLESTDPERYRRLAPQLRRAADAAGAGDRAVASASKEHE